MSASAPLIPPAMSESAIRARHPFDRGPGPAAAAHRCADASRWRGTRAGKARECPDCRPLGKLGHAPKGGFVKRRILAMRECWCRAQSRAAILIDQIAQRVPRGPAKLPLEPPTLEAGPAHRAWPRRGRDAARARSMSAE